MDKVEEKDAAVFNLYEQCVVTGYLDIGYRWIYDPDEQDT